jgi:hypothetical protein
VEQKVIADKRPEGVQGRTLLPAVLIQPEIQKVLVGEDGKGGLSHAAHILSLFPLYHNF